MKNETVFNLFYEYLNKPILPLLFIFIVLSCFTLTSDNMHYDEGMWNYVSGNWINHGIPPYTGSVENKSPNIFYLFSLSNLLFGINLFFPRFLGIFSMLLCGLFLFLFTKKLYNHLAGTFTLLVFGFTMTWYSMDGAYPSMTESFMILFIVLSFFTLLGSEEQGFKKRLWTTFLAGLFVGTAVSFKQVALTSAFALFCFHLLRLRQKRVLHGVFFLDAVMIMLGILSACVLSYLPLAFSGVTLRDYFQDVWMILLFEGQYVALGERTWKFILTWSDEPDAGTRYTNQPDEFTLNVTAPNGTSVESGPLKNTHGREVVLVCEFLYDPETVHDTEGTGRYALEIICGECGDQEPSVSVFGLRTISDAGNTWTLDLRYEYLAMP